MKNILPVTVLMMLLPCMCLANGITVTNVNISASGNTNNTWITCDTAWNNSFRVGSPEQRDAAWVFAKYQTNGVWGHCTLSTNSADYSTPAGVTIEPTEDGMGVFVYRNVQSGGTFSANDLGLAWSYLADNISTSDTVSISVLAIEMVYVPQGSFYVGSGGTESGSFTDGSWSSGATIPFAITNESALIVSNSAGYLWGTSTVGNNTIGVAGTLPAEYPKGYNAFYCMKYEISQGQYADFLNMLTAAQATTRFPNQNGNYRHTISGTYPNFSASVPDRACNYLSWADGAAYADWVGLRPMTELEFEKACRGPLAPVANEYAWGTSACIDDDGDGTIDVTSPEDGTEIWTNSAAAQLGISGRGAAVFGYNQIKVGGVTNGLGPVRCGLFATATSTRITSGAAYWGIMEMSGNLWERPVSVGHATGRAFTGTHGDGVLDGSGNADTTSWPASNAIGAGFRGGDWHYSSGSVRASGRYNAAYVYSSRRYYYGFRAGRVAPFGE